MAERGDPIDASPRGGSMTDLRLKRNAAELAGLSFAALSLELALIRWLPGEVRVVAYFPNVVLLASFLGLGLGALRRRVALALTLPALLLLVATAIAASGIAFTASGVSEHLWLLYFDLPEGAPVVNGVVLPVFVAFVLATLPFVPIGAAIASRLGRFQEAGRSLQGYAVDLAGSLAGVLAFLLLAALGVRPTGWFACGLLPLVLVITGRGARALAALASVALLVLVQRSDDADRYSPYYALRVVESDGVTVVLTNGSLHQKALDLRASAPLPADSAAASMRQGMRMPLLNLDHLPRRALVLGAGTGNDVAILLDAGVGEVHAVEIDPEILAIGRERHPSRPYQDPRVVVHVMDARRFLETTDLEFDYIVVGTLDSMTRLSALSNVRLDNFVYTRESIVAARRRLAPDGGMALFFWSIGGHISDHLYALLDQAFGKPPLSWRNDHRMFNLVLMAGPGFAHLEGAPHLVDQKRLARRDLLVAPEDDWPYLYLKGRGVPGFYLVLIALVIGFAALAVLGVSGELRRDLVTGKADLEMLLFGVAFLLLETSFVTDMNLVFGATWKTSGIVFAAILAAVLTATLVATRLQVRATHALAGVVAALTLFAFLPLRSVAPVDPVLRVAFVAAVCGLPVGLAGLAFADRFRARPSVESAFGWNLFGAVLGGLVEFSSMAIGLRALFLVAALIYLVLILRLVRAGPAATVAAGGGVRL